MAERVVVAVTGKDREPFLQNLVTSDVARARGGVAGFDVSRETSLDVGGARGAIAYAALLTPQGKYLADFLLVGEPDRILLDVEAGLAPSLLQRLSLYRLRADVALEPTDLRVRRGTGPAPAGALADPRHPALGWRLYGAEGGDDGTDWDAVRVEHVIPESGIELTPDTFILEAGFERLGGVDFRKGCYVGQEVTARMKHKAELRKGLVRVEVEGAASPGTPILLPDGREAGTLFTQRGGRGIAQMRFDRGGEGLAADDARVTWRP